MFEKNIVFSCLPTYTICGGNMIIVGIIGRPALVSGNKGIVAYKTLCDRLFNYGVFPICLIPSIKDDLTFSDEDLLRLKQMTNFCHGIILQGGEEFNDLDKEIAKYLYDENMPVLGICLGMQIMGSAFNGVVLNDANHNISKDYVHYVKINRNSKLHDIIGKDYIYVNSKHNDRVYTTDLDVVANFGEVVEGLEDSKKDFYVGVQWHPEFLDDENSDRLFRAFLDACKNKQNNI